MHAAPLSYALGLASSEAQPKPEIRASEAKLQSDRVGAIVITGVQVQAAIAHDQSPRISDDVEPSVDI